MGRLFYTCSGHRWTLCSRRASHTPCQQRLNPPQQTEGSGWSYADQRGFWKDKSSQNRTLGVRKDIGKDIRRHIAEADSGVEVANAKPSIAQLGHLAPDPKTVPTEPQ